MTDEKKTPKRITVRIKLGDRMTEEERRIYEQCRNVSPHRDEPQTNFDRITQSPEALTSWLDEHVGFCMEISCDECVAKKECWRQGNDTDYSNGELWYAWLQRESESRRVDGE